MLCSAFRNVRLFTLLGPLNIAAPYGIAPGKFRSDTINSNSLAKSNITGYDVSSNSGPHSAPGWKLAAGVKDGMSLSDATTSSFSKNQVFEVTTMYIEAPSGMKMDVSWKICAILYPDFDVNALTVTAVDGM